MKHTVILAHPDPKSLNASLARAYCEAVRGLGDEVRAEPLRYAVRPLPEGRGNSRPQAA